MAVRFSTTHSRTFFCVERSAEIAVFRFLIYISRYESVRNGQKLKKTAAKIDKY